MDNTAQSEEIDRVGEDLEPANISPQDPSQHGNDTESNTVIDVNITPEETAINDTKEPETVEEGEHMEEIEEEEDDGQGGKEEKHNRTGMLLDPVIVRRHDFIARDVQDFLLNYPDQRDDKDITANIKFYNNEVRFRPYGVPIDEFHERAAGRYRLLEQNHSYIQWLFPIREQGLNSYSYPLQPHEAATIRQSPEMKTRLLTSLSLMLDFYGMAISTTNRLLITRHANPRVCAKQYENLVYSYHNYLRITRVFKSLVELGLPDYVPSILLFILAEQSEFDKLDNRELRGSMDRYWVYCMREREAQKCVATAIRWVRTGEGKFTKQMYRRLVETKINDGVWKFDAPKVEVERKTIERGRGFGSRFLGRLRSLRS